MLLSAVFSLSLFFCGVVGQKWSSHTREKTPHVSQTLCPSYPYPQADPSTVQKALGPFLEEVGKNMSRVLSETPGGAVVSVVYRDTVIWTRGVGAINMSGKSIAHECTKYRASNVSL